MEFFKANKSRRHYGLVEEIELLIGENAVRIVIELIAQKDATVIAIMTQEAKEVKI